MHRIHSVVAVVTVFFVTLPSLVTADTHVVDAGGSGDFLTIQSAVDHATSGDTLRILAGTYVESVVATDKRVVCIGDGIGSTTLRGSGDSPAYEVFLSDPGRIAQWFIDMSIEASPENEWAVRWEGRAKFIGCETTGRIGSDAEYDHYGDAVLQQTSATYVTLSGSGATTLEDCVIGDATFSGYYYFDPWGGGTYCYHHSVSSTGTQFSSVSIGCCGFDSSQDYIGHLELGTWSSCEAIGTVFGSVGAGDGALLSLDGCTVEGDIDLQPACWVHSSSPQAILTHCTVYGDLRMEQTFAGGSPHGMLDVSHSTVMGDLISSWSNLWSASTDLQHNTIMGNLVSTWNHIDWVTLLVRGNIITGQTRFEFIGDSGWALATHNDFVGGLTLVSCSPDSIYANLNEDPLMCNPDVGDLTLQECSPCVGAAHDGGDMGAHGVGCACLSAVLPTSWGRLKALYR